MNYNLKKLKENELQHFFLNPFERSACFGNIVIQKYAVSSDIDDFILLNLSANKLFRAGFVLYEKHQIIVEEGNLLNTKVLDSAPFVRINKIKESIRETIEEKLIETNESDIDRISIFISNLSDETLVNIASGSIDSFDAFLKELKDVSHFGRWWDGYEDVAIFLI